MPESKSLQRFRSRVEHLEQHVQAVDVCVALALATTKANPKAAKTILGAIGKDHDKYSRLRQPVGESPRVFNYSKSQSYEHALIALYRHFGEYLRGILEEMYATDPLAIVGKVSGSSLQFHELVQLGSFDAIVKRMIDTTFRRLEDERSTTKLLDKIVGHTKIKIDDVVREEALRYLELRHLFIHNGGRCDAVFEKAHGKHLKVKDGDDLPTDFKTTSAAFQAVTKLLKAIDHELLHGKYVAPRVAAASQETPSK